MSRRALAVVTLAVVVAIGAAAILYARFGAAHGQVQAASQAPALGTAEEGKPAPQFEVATTGGLFDLSKADKVVFLEVFATWCPHCQREVKVVDRLYRQYKSRVEFVAVSGSDTAMDGLSTSSELDVLNWVNRFKVAYPVAYDPLLNVAHLYLKGGFPTFTIIGKDKIVKYRDDGEISYDELNAALKAALR